MGENHLNCPDDCAANVTVSVIDALTRAPITGALVRCSSSMDVLGPVSTRNSNSYTFEGQYQGLWTCRADKVGYNHNTASSQISPPFACVGTNQIVVPLRYKHACIFGLVYDDATDAPIAGATVTCTSGSNSFPVTTTDLNGKWFHDLVVSGTWKCVANAPGYLTGTTTQNYDFDEKK